jgi:hypothetical protein
MRRRFGTACATAVTVAGLAVLPATTAQAETPAEITRAITYNGRTVTARMHPIDLRAAGFEVLLQKADGSLEKQPVGLDRTWIGGVDGEPGAIASGIVRSDGVFEGTVAFDRGAIWRFRDSSVFQTRGLTQPTTYKWPSSTDAARNVSTSPGQAGTTTHRFDLGFDLANDWFTHTTTINGSVARAVDSVESTAAAMLAVYEPNALLRPAVGRIIIRGAAEMDPYASDVDPLGKARTEWSTNQTDAGVDNVVLQHTPTGGGGTAWVGTAGTTSGVSQNAGSGDNLAVIRHEVGHNWGAFDNHTNGPEGATIQSGNQFHRFDGTELSAIFRYRDSRQRSTAPFTAEATFAEPVPPYAALDLVDSLDATVPVNIRPVANDHDANGDALTLQSVSATSNAGGTLTRNGDTVTYTPPTVTTRTVDWAQYVVRDASGKTATGVMLLRVDPYVAPNPETWPAQEIAPGSSYELLNRASGHAAAAPVGATGTAQLLQRPRGDAAARWSVRALASGVELKNNASGLCADVEGSSTADGAAVLQYACHGGTNQQWKVVSHPKGDSALINVRSGKCLAPRDLSLDSDAPLVQVSCGLSASQAWKIGIPPVGEWPAATPPTGAAQELVNVGSGLHAGVPVGSPASTKLTLTPKGAGTAFTFVPNADGTWRLRLETDGRCADDAGGAHKYVVTWGCGEANLNQKFRVLQHPLGDFALVGTGSNECLATEGAATAAGTSLTLESCGTGGTQRWRVEPSAPAPTFFENTADVAIPDNNNTGVTSPIAVTRAGAAPATLKVGVDIVHPWIGDLVVELVAPDGTAYVLHNRSGGSADNIATTYTVDASAELASGTWQLRVKDVASADTGRINGWSLQF